MRKWILCLLCAGTLSTACADAERTTTNLNALPNSAKSFLQTHFANVAVRQITVETEWTRNQYEVDLIDGSEVDFDHGGNWKKVECGRNTVPTAIVPGKIATYVTQNYPQGRITSIEKDDGGYDVDLADDTDLRFNSKGKFVRIDY